VAVGAPELLAAAAAGVVQQGVQLAAAAAGVDQQRVQLAAAAAAAGVDQQVVQLKRGLCMQLHVLVVVVLVDGGGATQVGASL